MKKVNKIRALLDVNLLISVIIVPESKPDKIIQSWLKDTFNLLISHSLLDELDDVTSRRKFSQIYPLFEERSKRLKETLKIGADLIEPLLNRELPIHTRDPKDDYLLASALGGDADYLVTGDEDLLILNGNPALGKLKIISVKDFLSIL